MKKFRFNELKHADSERLLPILDDPEIKETIPGLYCQTLQDVESVFNYFNMFGNHLFEILDSNNNTVGILGAEYRSSNSLELSFFISKEFRNLHYASQSLKEFLMNLSQKNPNITDVFFFINKDNQKSRKTVESIGANFSHTYEDDEAVYRKTISSSQPDELFI